MDRRIKFRHLDAFNAIARARSFKVAAQQLNLTQPAISKTLKDLEDILGVTLMERSRAGVHLTPQGDVFLQFAEQSTAALRHGLRSLRSTQSSGGQLTIGALPSVASHLLPKSAMSFAKQNPDTVLEIHEGPHPELTSRLSGGDLDMVVGRMGRPDTMKGLAFQQLYTEEVVIVARTGSPVLHVSSFDDLDRFRILYPPKDAAIRPLVARLLIAQGVPLFPNRIETTSPEFSRAVVLRDPQSAWIISRGVVANDLAEGTLGCVDVDMSPTLGAVGIMTRSQEVTSVAARSFARALAEQSLD